MTPSTASPNGQSVQTLIVRYKDAYTIARAINGLGRLLEFTGVAVALIGAAIWYQLVSSNPRALPILFLAAAVVVLVFYVLGHLMRAYAQLLKATLDSAVNTSPLLDNEQRAKMMSLN